MYIVFEKIADFFNTYESTIFQWTMFISSIFLILSGVNAIQTKRCKNRSGRVYTGLEAQISGAMRFLIGTSILIYHFAVGWR